MTSMKPLLLPLALLACAAAVSAQNTQLAAPAARISDDAIQADHRAYETLQARIKGLNDGGRPLRDYHLAKAQCWLDVSFHEYTRNDRSAFPQAAMTESELLIRGMEAGRSPLPMDTPLVNDAIRLRPDLWERAAGLRSQPGWRCAQHKAACAEVELVHAGNEHAQQQWRHAKPYVQIAEDLLADAQALASACVPPPAPVVVAAPPVPPAAPPLPPIQALTLSAQVVFNFDQHDAANMRPFSIVQLEELVRRVQAERLVVQAIRLVGHADRLNSTGESDYNQRLSERRVQTVRAELRRLGLSDTLIQTDAQGDKQQVQGCEARFASPVDLRECLLPNRRVDVLIEARKP